MVPATVSTVVLLRCLFWRLFGVDSVTRFLHAMHAVGRGSSVLECLQLRLRRLLCQADSHHLFKRRVIDLQDVGARFFIVSTNDNLVSDHFVPLRPKVAVSCFQFEICKKTFERLLLLSTAAEHIPGVDFVLLRRKMAAQFREHVFVVELWVWSCRCRSSKVDCVVGIE
uniref:Putative secreted protein n=1 Tax=Ixodes ricinus TaxID=34613 RepID=A0A6B0UYX9_IXORI